MSADQEIVEATETAPDQKVVEPKAADPAAPKGEAADAQGNESAQDRDEKGRYRNPVQPRIDELTRKNREKEREAAYWRQRAEAAEKPKTPPPQKPVAENFEDYNAFVEALADWKADEKIKASNEARDKRDAETRTASERQTSWGKRMEDARTRVPDFDQVLSASDVPVAEHVSDLLQEAERGPEVMHAMAKDPSIADRLNSMSPKRAAIEIGRLEALLPAISANPDPVSDARTDEPAAKAETPPARKTSSAPPPIKQAPRGSSTTVDLAKASMDEFVKKRAAEGARWARR